ncbi:hypothetical protein [Amaricoccus macauensis]|uniref:hypothetical protein n=1 Tax=Amaricoccus macauensis TaxID=57001 RepID=UPI003C7DEDBE
MLDELRQVLSAAALVTLLPMAAMAQEQETAQIPAEPQLKLSLNAVDPTENGCLLTFMAENGFDSDIGQAVFETVLFSTDGRVERLLLFDMGTLPADRPRVRRFEVDGITCEGLGSVLINGAETCEAGDLGAGVCIGSLSVSSDTEIEIDG